MEFSPMFLPVCASHFTTCPIFSLVSFIVEPGCPLDCSDWFVHIILNCCSCLVQFWCFSNSQIFTIFTNILKIFLKSVFLYKFLNDALISPLEPHMCPICITLYWHHPFLEYSSLMKLREDRIGKVCRESALEAISRSACVYFRADGKIRIILATHA